MHRTVLSIFFSLWVLLPGMARAEDDVLTRVRDWFSGIGKPKPPVEEDLGARNTFTINPLALAHSQLGIEYERAFGRGFSLYVAPEFAYGRTPETWSLGLSGTLGIRLFVLGTAPSGIYFGPELSANYQLRSQERVRRRGIGVGLGGSVGWTLVLFNRFTLAAGFSAQYRSIPDLESPAGEGALRVEIVPTPRLAFGVAF
ncbi:hypothetical protein [Cystobacter ferrugineus]|uniref:DUF3575 domain-containing protein n=1 Tax=Cystobacter ferrugineus TaxID=83449 RepID=A0A1L9AUP7_9BACT|nr:hypothetical protein [Cystobacter ferrugineus]OJH33745.1 hypothetical protein BON30_46850 [Cystobacter ferrugineus]